MSIMWIILGTLFQACLVLFLFMLVAFSTGGIVNSSALNGFEVSFLNWLLYSLPCLCIICSAMVIYDYTRGGSTYSYWWYGLPLMISSLYIGYITLATVIR